MADVVGFDPSAFDAVLFDLDGVLTDTAELHATAWQEMFDDYLAERASRHGTSLEGFRVPADYQEHLDGKPRYDGVRDFLASRGIVLAEGTPDDPPEAETVCGLGNRKQQRFESVLTERGATTFDGARRFLAVVRARGMRTAVVSSSKNCRQIIEAAGIADEFDARVDGTAVEQDGLAGKPAPDTFLRAAAELGASPARAIVIEDARSGVEAGRAGGFGLVIGVDRHGDGAALLAHGADVVVGDLAELLG